MNVCTYRTAPHHVAPVFIALSSAITSKLSADYFWLYYILIHCIHTMARAFCGRWMKHYGHKRCYVFMWGDIFLPALQRQTLSMLTDSHIAKDMKTCTTSIICAYVHDRFKVQEWYMAKVQYLPCRQRPSNCYSYPLLWSMTWLWDVLTAQFFLTDQQ